MGQVIAITNQKGGVGKTTTAINLSASLAASEHKVLLIDLDTQANATSGLGFKLTREQPSIYEVLISKANIENTILQSNQLQNMYIIPSHKRFRDGLFEIGKSKDTAFILKKELDKIKNEFDFIIIDCPPSLEFLTTNALVATDSVIIPVQCEYYALEGIAQLLTRIRHIQKNFNPKLKIIGVLLTMYDKRLLLSRAVAEDVKKVFSEHVLNTIIYRNVKLAEAPSFGKPIICYDVSSTGAANYLNLADEILKAQKNNGNNRG